MKQPFVCFFGGSFTNLQKQKIEETTTPYFYQSDIDVNQILLNKQPQVLVSIGDSKNFLNLHKLSLRERNRWLHYPSEDECLHKLDQLTYCFISYAIKHQWDQELVTVFTTSYKSGEFIQRPYQSLLNQTYQHWEWIIFDDTDGDENFANLVKLRETDSRIRVYRAEKNSGVIGQMKNLASSLARGFIILELDHDDDLTPRSLQLCVQAAEDYPDAGFFHSDFCEIHEDGRNFSYGDHFGLGYGAYRKEWDRTREQWINVVSAIQTNAMTVRYLVSSPNHFRAWRTSLFRQIGGWNHNLHVADDYEIMVRSFLKTKIVRIPENCYFQYRNQGGNNHTLIRNKEIQKLWRTIAKYYNSQINQRLLQLGVEDPYYHTWEDHRQLNRAWYRSKYEAPLNYVLKIKGRDLPLVSFVIVCHQSSHLSQVKIAIELALRQSYPEIEIMVVGNQLSEFESLMEQLIPLWESESCPKININRAKDCLKWWNTNQKSNLAANFNYACKMIILGDLTCLIDLDRLNQFEEFYGQDFVSKAVELLKSDPELMIVQQRDSRHLLHRSSLYQKYGYWRGDQDLVKLWSDRTEKIQEI